MVCGKKSCPRERNLREIYTENSVGTEFSRYDATGARRSWGYCLLAASVIRAFGSVRPAPFLVAQCKRTRPYCLGLYFMLLIYYWCSVIVWPLISDISTALFNFYIYYFNKPWRQVKINMDGRKRLSGAGYRKLAEEKRRKENEVLDQTLKLDTFSLRK